MVRCDVSSEAARSHLLGFSPSCNRCEVSAPLLLPPHVSLMDVCSVVLIVIAMYKLASRGYHTANRCVLDFLCL